jgi:hypothetical protein
MKKMTLVSIVVIFMSVTNLFAQSPTDTLIQITNKVMKAYKTQDTDLLASYSSFYGKLEVTGNEDYWKEEDVVETVERAKNWDGQIRGIGYQTMKMGGKTMKNALVYLYDAPDPGKIYTLQFTKKDSGNWFLSMMGGIEEYDKSHLDNFKQDMDEFQKAVENAVKQEAGNQE